jgi:trehalose 6-phosphate phosphatase
MRRLHSLEGIPGRLWRLVSLARHRLLMLDYDGTLAPFVAERAAAFPLPRSLELVGEIARSTHTDVAIVSGRPLADVERFIGALPVTVVGEHGWERRGPDGIVVRGPLTEPTSEALEAAERVAREGGWGDRLERKRASVVLHTRGLPAREAGELERLGLAAWGAIATGRPLALDRIDGGVELRAHGRHKGTAVLSLLSQAPEGTLGVFVGDDVTDEDAFDAIRGWGFGVRVGDPARPTIAEGRLPDCRAVPAFLEQWLARAGRG